MKRINIISIVLLTCFVFTSCQKVQNQSEYSSSSHSTTDLEISSNITPTPITALSSSATSNHTANNPEPNDLTGIWCHYYQFDNNEMVLIYEFTTQTDGSIGLELISGVDGTDSGVFLNGTVEQTSTGKYSSILNKHVYNANEDSSEVEMLKDIAKLEFSVEWADSSYENFYITINKMTPLSPEYEYEVSWFAPLIDLPILFGESVS